MSSTLSKYNLLIILATAILVIAIPLIIIQVQKQQTVKQRAASPSTVSLQFDPKTITKAKNDSFNVDINLINTDPPKEISAVDVTIKYNSLILDSIAFQPDPGFNSVINEQSQDSIHYVATVPAGSIVKIPIIKIGSLTLKGKSEGTETVTLSNIMVTASGIDAALPVNADNITGQYIITGSATGVINAPPPASTTTSASCPDNQNISSTETAFHLNKYAPSITLNIEKLYVTRGGTTYSWLRGKCSPTLLSGPLLEGDRVIIVLSKPYNDMILGNDPISKSRLTLGGILYYGNRDSDGKEQIVIDPWPSALIAPPFVLQNGQGGSVGTPTSPFYCSEQIGTFAGKYQCADIKNGSLQCLENYSQYQVSFTNCDNRAAGVATRGCCKQNAAVAAVPTAIPTATPIPINNVTLVLTLNAQDLPATTSATASNLFADLTLYNLTTNSPVAGAPASQSFAKTPIPGKQYSANVLLTNLQQNKYFIIARKDNMIAKAAFNVSSANETISVPTTILVFGDINNDNDINALDYNIFKNCWKKSVDSNPSCAPSDFDSNGGINQVDYNTWLRGFATWREEGK